MSEENAPILIEQEGQKVLRSMRMTRVIAPVTLGIAAVVYLFYTQFDLEKFKSIEWSARAWLWIAAAFALLLLRHLVYSYRLWVLSQGHFSFRKCISLMVIWEFSSALTPTSKGGPFVMLFVLTKEKLGAGRTAAAVFYSMICDSGFFVLLLPILLLCYGPIMLFPGMSSFSDQRLASSTFFVTYGMMVLYWSLLVFFLLAKPSAAATFLNWLGSLRIFKRYAAKLRFFGEEFKLAAKELKNQSWKYHAGVLAGTFGSWTSKFLLINCLIIALVPDTPVDGSTQAFIYARLVAMFVIMTFSPTPGGAGLAEIALIGFISDQVPPGVGIVIALIWRLMAYYGYLLMGALVVPGWVGQHFGKNRAQLKKQA